MADIQIDSDLANTPAVNVVVQTSDPTPPASGHAKLYVKAGGVYVLYDSGDPVAPGGVPSLTTDLLGVGSGDGLLSGLVAGATGAVPTRQADGSIAEIVPTGGGLTGAASVHRSTTQTISDDAWTPVAFDTEDWDSGALVDIGTHATRITCQESGRYHATGFLGYEFNSSGIRFLRLLKNGATSEVAATHFPNASNAPTYMSVSGDLALEAGDYIELEAYHYINGSTSLALVTSNCFPTLSLHRIP